MQRQWSHISLNKSLESQETISHSECISIEQEQRFPK